MNRRIFLKFVPFVLDRKFDKGKDPSLSPISIRIIELLAGVRDLEIRDYGHYQYTDGPYTVLPETELGRHVRLLEYLKERGYKELTPDQEQLLRRFHGDSD